MTCPEPRPKKGRGPSRGERIRHGLTVFFGMSSATLTVLSQPFGRRTAESANVASVVLVLHVRDHSGPDLPAKNCLISCCSMSAMIARTLRTLNVSRTTSSAMLSS